MEFETESGTSYCQGHVTFHLGSPAPNYSRHSQTRTHFLEDADISFGLIYSVFLMKLLDD